MATETGPDSPKRVNMASKGGRWPEKGQDDPKRVKMARKAFEDSGRKWPGWPETGRQANHMQTVPFWTVWVYCLTRKWPTDVEKGRYSQERPNGHTADKFVMPKRHGTLPTKSLVKGINRQDQPK